MHENDTAGKQFTLFYVLLFIISYVRANLDPACVFKKNNSKIQKKSDRNF